MKITLSRNEKIEIRLDDTDCKIVASQPAPSELVVLAEHPDGDDQPRFSPAQSVKSVPSITKYKMRVFTDGRDVISTWDSPLEAMTALVKETNDIKYFDWGWADCYRVVDGEQKECQWRIVVD